MLSNLAPRKNSSVRLKQQWNNKLMSHTSSLSRLQELLPQLFQSTQLPGDPYLRCQLTPGENVLLSMEYVQESLLVPGEQITPIPNMSAFVVGLMNSRDRVFCTIDLAQLLGVSSSSTYSRQYHIVVIRVSPLVSRHSTSESEQFLGLIVNRIQGITRVMSDEMRSPQENLPSHFAPYLQGWVINQEQSLPVLDIATVVQQSLAA